MNPSPTQIAKVVSPMLTFVVAQVFLGLTFAAPRAVDKRIDTRPLQSAAVLTTQGNQPITVDGVRATSGATILPGARIETPDGVSATLRIPGRGALMIPGNTQMTLNTSAKVASPATARDNGTTILATPVRGKNPSPTQP